MSYTRQKRVLINDYAYQGCGLSPLVSLLEG
jgi:hypothetical protein